MCLIRRGGDHATRRVQLALVVQHVLGAVMLLLLRVVRRYTIVVRLILVRHHAILLMVGSQALQLLRSHGDAAAVMSNLVHTHGDLSLQLRVLHRLLLLLLQNVANRAQPMLMALRRRY